MCVAGTTIKLCTCTEREILPPCWRLYRETGKERLSIVGSFMEPTGPDTVERIEGSTIVNALNTQNLFDFNYRPKGQDQLWIQLSPESEITCTFEEGEWRLDLRPSIRGIDFRLLKRGKLEIAG
jgi:hypothetical protein